MRRFLTAAVLSAPASGGDTAVPRLVFPLVAKTDLWDNYGDPRGNGSHAGIDMENPWRAPVVAVEDGRIKYWESGLGGCMLYHYGASGTTYMYIHLNNDLTARNDNKGGCVKDVSFALPKGKMVALVGPSGAGKTTLADLLPRFHDPVGGQITMDGVPLTRLSRRSLRGLMGVVSQDTVLRKGLRQNKGMEREVERYRNEYCIQPAFLTGLDKLSGGTEANTGKLQERRIAYRLKTGANWAGPIKDFRRSSCHSRMSFFAAIFFPPPDSSVILPESQKRGQKVLGRHLRMGGYDGEG